jgi:hypothetical protein
MLVRATIGPGMDAGFRRPGPVQEYLASAPYAGVPGFCKPSPYRQGGVDLTDNGKFSRGALAISIAATTVMLILLAIAMALMTTGHGSPAINYWIGMCLIFCWLFELIAIVVGIIGLFEGAPNRRRALSAVILSFIVFVVPFVFAIVGSHGSHGG